MNTAFSVVIPVYNEEAIVEAALRRYAHALDELGRPFEILVSANGCTDSTEQIVGELELHLEHGTVRLLSSSVPDYGRALRNGILEARGDVVVCDEIDLCDIGFVTRALRRLDHDECELVVGSKAMIGARDRRPWMRRVGTRVINGMLWAAVGFEGTDTHGLKAFRRRRLLPIVRACVVDKDLFASELVIRAGRSGLRIQEIPIELEEQRSPAIHLVRRVPRVMRDLARLMLAVRLGPDPDPTELMDDDDDAPIPRG
ncbi:MAG: glycosyltransferase family 2 protein [Deltaproteobacteria bacterium]|nr:glycosyltransferase family 2 protein [Deltaproteobacteria bacterium]